MVGPRSRLLRRRWVQCAWCCCAAGLVVIVWYSVHAFRLSTVRPISTTEMIAAMAQVSSASDDTIIVTAVNSHLFDLLLLRRKALELNYQRHVELLSFIVCLDRPCVLLCRRHNVPNCHFTEQYQHTKKSGMFTKEYIRINYEKFQILEHALTVSKNALLLDTDVLLFRNPWPHILRTGHAVHWQHEGRADGQCNVTDARYGPNGGVLYVSQNATSFFSAFYQYEDIIMHAQFMNETDQAFILPAVLDSGTDGCPLDSTLFVGKCQYGRDRRANFRSIISFHATCTAHRRKHRVLNEFIRQTRVAQML